MVSSFPAQDWSAGLSGHITVDLKEVSLRSCSSGLIDVAFFNMNFHMTSVPEYTIYLEYM